MDPIKLQGISLLPPNDLLPPPGPVSAASNRPRALTGAYIHCIDTLMTVMCRMC